MRLAKRSNAFNRIFNKFYKFNYITCLIGALARTGFKLHASKIIMQFLFKVKLKENQSVENLLNLTFNKYIPLFGFLSKKIAATTYYLPWLINFNRACSLFIRWFVKSTLLRSESNIVDKFFNEFLDLKLGYGKTVKILEEYYSLALQSRPFLRFLRKRRKVFLSRLKKYGVR